MDTKQQRAGAAPRHDETHPPYTESAKSKPGAATNSYLSSGDRVRGSAVAGTLVDGADRSRWSRFGSFVRLGRPKFLLQSTAAIGLGVTIAAYDGHQINYTWYVITLLGVWCAHLMAHYSNEFFDLKADKANTSHTEWTGGSRVLVRGLVQPSTSVSAAYVLLFTAMMLVVVVPDTVLRVLAVLGLALAWFYTAPPVRLNYRGLGELTTAVTLYGLAPVGSYYFQAHSLSTTVFAVVCPIFLFQLARQFLMNLSDFEGDRKTGKRTVAVLLGPRRLVRAYMVVQAVAYCLIVTLGLVGALPPLVATAMVLTSVLPLWISRQLVTGAMAVPARANAVTFWASMQLPAGVCAAMLSLLLDAALYGNHGEYTEWAGVAVGTSLVCTTWVVGWLLAKPSRERRLGEPSVVDRRGGVADPVVIHDLDAVVFVVGNATQTAWFYQVAFGMSLVAYSGPETGNRDYKSYVLKSGSARFVINGGVAPDSPLLDHHRRHGDGVTDLALEVGDVDQCVAHAREQGATVLEEPHDVSDENGTVRIAAIAAYGETRHSLIDRSRYSGPYLTGYVAGESTVKR